MRKEAPPASARSGRKNKFDFIAAELSKDPGEWYNITEDVQEAGAEDKGEGYYTELARSITAGNRAAFRPRGAFQGRSEATQIWARAVPEGERAAAAKAAEEAASEASEAGDQVDAEDAELQPA